MEQALSSNHFSHERQLTDVLNWLQTNDPDTFKKFIAEFPEWSEAKGDMALIMETFDDEWPMWATDWIENVTDITWEDGEPWLLRGLGRRRMSEQGKEVVLWLWAIWMLIVLIIGIATGHWEPFIGSFLGIMLVVGIFLITGDFDDET